MVHGLLTAVTSRRRAQALGRWASVVAHLGSVVEVTCSRALAQQLWLVGPVACGIVVDQGTNQHPLGVARCILTTGIPGKPKHSYLFLIWFPFLQEPRSETLRTEVLLSVGIAICLGA